MIQITEPGYWLIASPKTTGIVHYTQPGQVNLTGQAFYLGATEQAARQVFPSIATEHAQLLFEYPGGLSQLFHDAFTQGHALMAPKAGSLQWDLAPTAIIASTVAIIAAPIIGAGAAGAGAAGAGAAGGEVGAGEAAGAGAAGGAGASGAIKAATKAITSNAGKIASGLTVASLFADPGIWKGIGMVLAGAILAILALRQFGMVSTG